MTRYDIDGIEAVFLYSPNSLESKFGRAAMIASRYEKIFSKMEGMVRNDIDFPVSEDYCHAVCVMLMLTTGIRIGNEDSAEGYETVPPPNSKIKPQFVKTYGLTTMRREHALVKSQGPVKFAFLGKKHVMNYFTLREDVSKYFRRIYDSGYDPLFNTDEGRLTSFIKREVSKSLTSKDFRTFRANVYASEILLSMPKPEDKKQYKEAISECAEYVSGKLNNTEGVVKKSYIDPQIFPAILGKEFE